MAAAMAWISDHLACQSLTLQYSSMVRIVLECDAEGLSAQIGEQAAIDVAEEFAHRP